MFIFHPLSRTTNPKECFIFGGWTPAGGAGTSISRFVESSLTFSAASLPSARQMVCIGAINDLQFSFGGSGASIFNTIIRFNTASYDVSTDAQTLSNTLYYACCSSIFSNMYVFGGVLAGVGSSAIQKYDGTSRTTAAQTLAAANYEVCSSAINRSAYIFGQWNGTASNIIQSYDGTTRANASVTLSTILSDATCGALSSSIFVYGGHSTAPVDTIQKFTITTIYTMVAVLPTVLKNAACSTVKAANYIFCGNSSGTTTSTIKKYDGTTMSLDSASFTAGFSNQGANSCANQALS